MIPTVCATIKRNRKKLLRTNYLSSVIGRLIASIYTIILSIFVFNYMASGTVEKEFSFYAGTTDYLVYIIIGAVSYSTAISILMAVGRFFMMEVREGTIYSLLITPASKLSLLLGSGLEQMQRSICEVAAVFLVCFAINISIPIPSLAQIFIILFSFFFSIFSMGIFVAYLMLFFRDTYITQNTIFLLISILCGISFPIQYLPIGVQYLSELIPLTHALQLIRTIIYMNAPFVVYQNILCKLLVTTALFWGIGMFLLKSYFCLHDDKL